MSEGYVSQTDKEVHWLPRLAQHLPHHIPGAVGRPGHGYPIACSVYGWLGVETASGERIADLVAFADELANFLLALERIERLDAPLAGAHHFFRGGERVVYDADTRACVAALSDRVDGAPLLHLSDSHP